MPPIPPAVITAIIYNESTNYNTIELSTTHTIVAVVSVITTTAPPPPPAPLMAVVSGLGFAPSLQKLLYIIKSFQDLL